MRITFYILVGLVLISYTYSQTKPQALAPILVGPYDGSDVSENQIVWTWFMQPRASNSQEIICDLKVVEVLNGQTPEEALRVNPLVILKEDLTTSAWQTNFAARNFIPGHRYAWRVIAKVRDPKTQQESVVSESEMWTYTYNVALSDIPEVKKDTVAIQPPEVTEPEVVASGPKAIEFTGRSRVTMEHNDAIGLLTESPKNLARWQIEPTLKLFGVPFGLNLLVTSEENTRKSDVSRGAFGSQNTKKGLNLVLQQRIEDAISDLEQARDSASVDSLRNFAGADSIALANRISALYELQEKNDLSESMESLKELGVATNEQELIAKFPAIGFGKVAPSFSRFMFNGVTINGALIEYNPGNFYTAGAIGKVQRDVDASKLPSDVVQRDSSLLSNVQLFKNVYSARIGYGRRNGNNIVASVMYADDDDQSDFIQKSIQRPIVDTIRTVKQIPFVTESGDTLRDPDDSTKIIQKDTTLISTTSRQNLVLARQQNTVIGLSSHFADDSLNISVEGEFNISYFFDSENKLWSKGDSVTIKTQFLNAQRLDTLYKPTENELLDFNYALRGSWKFLENTGRLSGGIRYVGAGFQSVGVAGLRKDVLRSDVLYDQSLLEKQLKFTGGYTREEFGYKVSDNPGSKQKSSIDIVRTGTQVRLRGLPVFTVDFALNSQKFSQSRDTVKNDTTLTGKDTTVRVVTIPIEDNFNNAITQWTLTTSHLYGSPSFRLASFVSYMHQQGVAKQTLNGKPEEEVLQSPNSFQSQTIQFTQRVGLGEIINFGLSGSYTETFASAKDTSKVTSVDVSALFSPFHWLPITVGFIHSKETNRRDETNGGYLNFRAQPFESTSIDFRVDQRNFSRQSGKGFTPNGFTGLTARLIINTNW